MMVTMNIGNNNDIISVLPQDVIFSLRKSRDNHRVFIVMASPLHQ